MILFVLKKRDTDLDVYYDSPTTRTSLVVSTTYLLKKATIFQAEYSSYGDGKGRLEVDEGLPELDSRFWEVVAVSRKVKEV